MAQPCVGVAEVVTAAPLPHVVRQGRAAGWFSGGRHLAAGVSGLAARLGALGHAEPRALGRTLLAGVGAQPA